MSWGAQRRQRLLKRFYPEWYKDWQHLEFHVSTHVGKRAEEVQVECLVAKDDVEHAESGYEWMGALQMLLNVMPSVVVQLEVEARKKTVRLGAEDTAAQQTCLQVSLPGIGLACGGQPVLGSGAGWEMDIANPRMRWTTTSAMESTERLYMQMYWTWVFP